MLLVGQSNFDQSDLCRSDLKKKTWRQHHSSNGKSALLMDVKLYTWLVMVEQCVGLSYTSPAVDYRFHRVGTPRKKVARSSHICMPRSEEPRAVFAS